MRLRTVVLASVAALLGTFVVAVVTKALLLTTEFGPLPNEAAALKAGCVAINQQYWFFEDGVECSSLEAGLEGDVWIIGRKLPPHVSGGGPIVKLRKTDGRLLDFYVTA